MRRAIPLLVLFSLGCAELIADQRRCDYLNERVRMCVGDDFGDVACDGVSERDLETIIATLDRSGCAFVREAVPLDGDLTSSTCRLFGEGCVESIQPPVEMRPNPLPVVLVNGIDTSPLFRYSDRIVDTMRIEGGHDVHLATLTPYETPPRRAAELWTRVQEILADTGRSRVHLICHSLGGLDCRYLVSEGGLHHDVEATHAEILGRVASITTVGTAHRGTAAADAALGLLPDYEQSAGLDALATYVGDHFTERDLEEDVHLRESIAAISTPQAAAFNVDVPDPDGLYIQSWAGFSRPFGAAPEGFDARVTALCQADGEDGMLLYRGTHDYMASPLIPSSDIVAGDDDVPNDGLVAIESARWGRFRGCVPADHMEQLGQRDLPDANVRTGFDVARFYAAIAAELGGMGL